MKVTGRILLIALLLAVVAAAFALAGEKKGTVCHLGTTTYNVSLSVHLAHNDTLGACPSSPHS